MYAEFSETDKAKANIMEVSKEDIVIMYLALEEFSRSPNATNPQRTAQIAKCLNRQLEII